MSSQQPRRSFLSFVRIIGIFLVVIIIVMHYFPRKAPSPQPAPATTHASKTQEKPLRPTAPPKEMLCQIFPIELDTSWQIPQQLIPQNQSLVIAFGIKNISPVKVQLESMDYMWLNFQDQAESSLDVWGQALIKREAQYETISVFRKKLTHKIYFDTRQIIDPQMVLRREPPNHGMQTLLLDSQETIVVLVYFNKRSQHHGMRSLPAAVMISTSMTLRDDTSTLHYTYPANGPISGWPIR